MEPIVSMEQNLNIEKGTLNEKKGIYWLYYPKIDKLYHLHMNILNLEKLCLAHKNQYLLFLNKIAQETHSKKEYSLMSILMEWSIKADFFPKRTYTIIGMLTLFFGVVTMFNLDVVQEIMNKTYDLNFFQVVLISLFSYIFHECGHAAWLREHDITSIILGFALLLGILPTFYIRHKVYVFSKQQKISYYFSGCLANLFLILVSFVLGLIFGNDNMIAYLIIINGSIIFLNLVPFFVTDGYQILSVLFDEYNLRKKFTQVVKEPSKFATYSRFVKWYISLSFLSILFIDLNAYCKITQYTNNVIGVVTVMLLLIFQVIILRR
ncbi:M50 family metallopeptidase [uncultured Vagococcus sp.]|uniref:M50 family metallopeptidase n=1 Tax=uncultured Vagococcus sp. TaxID=189676 RepID=UPI0028D834E5|nr:M50 family metallopeptidase [uncultured Vagococcus sp.]